MHPRQERDDLSDVEPERHLVVQPEGVRDGPAAAHGQQAIAIDGGFGNGAIDQGLHRVRREPVQRQLSLLCVEAA